MQLTKPKIEATRITLTNPATNKSRSITVYGASRDDLFDRIQKMARAETPKPREARAAALV